MEGKFEELKRYILENATKHSNGTPIFSARYFAKMIDQAKKEFPCFDCVFFPYDELCETRHEDSPCALFPCKKWFMKWFGKEK